MATQNQLSKPVDGAKELVLNLLNEAHTKYDINYGGYLANHLSHGLYTLYALGATKTRLQEFNDHYTKKLEPLRKPNFTINDSNFLANIGNKKLYAEFLQHFQNDIISNGLFGTFKLYIDRLMGESFGAALHPLIHIGYALEFSNEDLLCEGLAYACIYPLQRTNKILDDIGSDFGAAGGGGGSSIVHIINELRNIEIPGLSDDVGKFLEKMQFLLDNHGTVFKNLISKWDLSQTDYLAKLNELTEASILGVFATYPTQIDFFLLHGLTGNHAVRTIFPHLSAQQQQRILRVNLLVLLVTYVIQRKPKIDVGYVAGYKKNESDDSISWESIIKATITIDEEHVSKAVRSVIYYMENVPRSQRFTLFSDEFLKRCAFKMVDLLRHSQDYIF